MSKSDAIIKGLNFKDGSYRTVHRHVPLLWKTMPTLGFYRFIFPIIWKAGVKAKRGEYDDAQWCRSSLDVLRAIERIGIRLEITGTEHFTELKEPCVFLANHMSTLETFVLPIIIAPFRKVTFVVKQSLVETPVFKHVMRSRNPVTVGRANPREDLKSVLNGGTKRLKAGISIIIFPQTTRFLDFSENTFNSIGIKLARKAGVPVIPIALKTDAWGNGRYLKDFGKMDPSKRVHFAFGKPVWINDRGLEEHGQVIAFIREKLHEWSAEVS